MYRRSILAMERIPTKAALPAIVALLGCLFTGCFQGQEERSARTHADADMSSLSRPFSFGRSGGPSAAQPEILSVDSLSGSLVESRRLGTGILIFAEGNPFSSQSAEQTRSTEFGPFVPATSENWDLSALDTARSRPGAPSGSPRIASAALYLDRPFGSLFASLFNRGNEEAGPSSPPAASPRDETAANPFTEARQKAEASPPPSKAANEDPLPTKEDGSSKPAAADSPAAPSPPGPLAAAARPLYVFVGDFDGSGRLKAVDAERLGETAFLFPDANRIFNFYVNPSAVESQRSFGVEDLNGDDIADLLVTARSSLFGGLLLGNPDGSYTVSDSFLTGYEPVVATAGPYENGRRDIATVNVRTGEVNTFRPQPQYRRGQSPFSLGFIPDFISHLVETQTGDDFFMAGQAGNLTRSFHWNSESTLDPTTESTPVSPDITLDRDFLRKNAAATVQVYQVGPYASITLTNSRRQSFNVANLRVTPRVFIAIGTFSNNGTLDVAVAHLQAIKPK